MTSLQTIARKNAEVTDYSLEDLERFQKKFSAEMNEHRAKDRRFVLPMMILFVAGFGVVFYSLLLQPPLTLLLVTGFALVAVGLILMTMIAVSFQPKLVCPACSNNFIEEIQNFCPECASDSLGPHNWRGARHCNTCGKTLRQGKNRNFKYKFCTTCGIFLYGKGI